MADEKDIFSEIFGETPEEKAALERQKQKQAEKQKKEAPLAGAEKSDALKKTEKELEEKPVIAEKEKGGTETTPEKTESETKPENAATDAAKKKRAYKKKAPEEKQKIEPLVEQAEQRSAIKKIVLEKAQQAIKTVKSLGALRKEKTETEKGEEAEDDNAVHQFLEDEVFEETSDDVLKEEGIREEGISARETAEKRQSMKPITPQTVLPASHDVPLKFLEDAKKQLVFIGRKKSVFGKYGDQAALYIGKVDEEGSEAHEKKVCLDSLNPHVVFVCGARGSGKCLTGDSLVTLEDGSQIPIKDLENDFRKVMAISSNGKLVAAFKTGFFKRTVQKILEVGLKSGKIIRLTPEHPLLEQNGWKPAQELRIGAFIATPVLENFFAQKNLNAQVQNQKTVLLQKSTVSQDIVWDEIVEKTELTGEFEVFDISVPTHHNFVANDIIVHNSYVLGVIAEELAWKNPNVGTIVVDPVGVFWSMRLPNRDEKEVGLLGQYDLLPQGLNNLKVFVPKGISNQVPQSTYDAAFSMQPSLLTVEDWCLTFGMDRFSPTGLLLEKSLAKVKDGYKNIAGKTMVGKKEKYSLDELISCLETDAELNSREKGYKQDSIRALVSRFEAAKGWGIFDEKGTPLSALSKEGQLTVLDTSFLDDAVTALVIGILARRVLAARKVSTRKEAAQRLKTQNMDDLLELEIPPTWLFIDEAHTLIPSGNVKTPATSALVEYVKQGRRPGCSLVFATQQPAAIDTRVLSQLDILISHKLVFDDDIKAVYKRIPAIIPNKFKVASFIKTLPVGVGLTADRREETSRAFVLKIRPRMSQHEGRDTETVSQAEPLKPEQVEKLAVEMVWGKLEKDGTVEMENVREAVSAMNLKYQSKGQLEKVLKGLEKKGALVEELAVLLPGRKKVLEPEETEDLSSTIESTEEEIGIEEAAEAEEKPKERKAAIKTISDEGMLSGIELISFPIRITQKQAEKIADSKRQKKALGLFGNEELVRSVQLFHEPIYRVKLDVMVHKGVFVSKTVFVSAVSGEFVHFIGNRFVESKGIAKVWSLSDATVKVLRSLNSQKRSAKQLMQSSGESEEKVKRALAELLENKLAERIRNEQGEAFILARNTDIPKEPMHKLLDSLDKAPFEKAEAVAIAERSFEKKMVPELVQKLFPSCLTKKIEEVYRPFYAVEIEKGESVRTIRIDAFNGSVFG